MGGWGGNHSPSRQATRPPERGGWGGPSPLFRNLPPTASISSPDEIRKQCVFPILSEPKVPLSLYSRFPLRMNWGLVPKWRGPGVKTSWELVTRGGPGSGVRNAPSSLRTQLWQFHANCCHHPSGLHADNTQRLRLPSSPNGMGLGDGPGRAQEETWNCPKWAHLSKVTWQGLQLPAAHNSAGLKTPKLATDSEKEYILEVYWMAFEWHFLFASVTFLCPPG